MSRRMRNKVDRLDFVEQVQLLCFSSYKVSVYAKAIVGLKAKGVSNLKILDSSLYADMHEHKACHDYLRNKLVQSVN